MFDWQNLATNLPSQTLNMPETSGTGIRGKEAIQERMEVMMIIAMTMNETAKVELEVKIGRQKRVGEIYLETCDFTILEC